MVLLEAQSECPPLPNGEAFRAPSAPPSQLRPVTFFVSGRLFNDFCWCVLFSSCNYYYLDRYNISTYLLCVDYFYFNSKR